MIKAPPLRDALLEVRGTDWKTRQLHMSVPGSTSDLRDGGDLRDQEPETIKRSLASLLSFPFLTIRRCQTINVMLLSAPPAGGNE